MVRPVEDAMQEDDLVRLREPLRRYLRRVVDDDDELEDLVQETLLRVWEVRDRVARPAAASYAVVTARNLVQTRERTRQVSERHAHRLHEPPTVDGPEVEALRAEERRAAAQVLRTLRALRQDDLVLLGDGDDEGERSARRRSRLARARSRARVDYLLRLRRVELPTRQCRPVLEALSVGDRRQQERVGAAQHLLTCPVCAGCADPLVARERRMFGVVAVPLLVLTEPVRRAFREAPRTSAAVAGAAAAAAIGLAAVAAAGGPETSPPTAAAPPASQPAAPPATQPAAAPADPGPLDPASTTPEGQPVGRPVLASSVLVLSVPADEGFWVGPDADRQTFVRLTPGAGESAAQVRPGDRVSFTGTVQRLAPGVADGVDPAEGLGLLEGQQAYVLVAPSAVVVG